MAKIEIDKESGFCFGVVTAIKKAEEQLAAGGTLYCLGDIVHNSDEVERLRRKGLHTITHEEMAALNGARVLLRAHGEPPSTYALARERGIDIVDATCPVVLKLQQRVKAAYDREGRRPQIVIYGKLGHAEVNGLVGQTDGQAIVVESVDDLDKLDFTRDIALFSQTTKSLEGYRHIIAQIESRKHPDAAFEHYDTICRSVSGRVERLRSFAASHEVVLFVAGTKSSNGRILYDQCRAVNPHTHLIANASHLDPAWLSGAGSVGICGATSTPLWLMEQVRDAVANIIPADE
ncbi:MAG: 4-hydroxy-3-methylbut-2-enyl diphosphate reductase [Muribaculaceae bacterium]|nr:4-hydroxy-3-methylbut-2-enyl diphosphate reductase [Muribaculaceae bacterium]